jgi:hypothetical protein
VTTLAVSVTATSFDAVLLQYKRSYFTGGFLAVDYITRPSQAFAFIVGSLLADAAVAGVLVALGLWLFGRLGVRRNVAFAAAITLALLPLLAADFVDYQLMTYLGDAFDFRLLFDLSGQSPSEIVAVSSAHVTRIAWLVTGTFLAAAAAMWTLFRFLPSRAAAMQPMPSRRSLVLPVALLFGGTIIMTLLRSGSDVLDNGLRNKPAGRLLGEIVEATTDADRDGYGVLGRPDDPKLFDSDVHPYALDIPGNGIDEDGVGGDLPANVEAYREAPTPSAPWHSTQDVVLILLEGFRADARGATVGGKPVTPVLDALAAQGIAPRLAYSHNGFTVQSRVHVFSGSVAGIRGSDTLIDDFKRHGYQTAYFSGQDDSFGGPEGSVGFERADVAYDARADRDRRYSGFSTAGSLAVPSSVLEERIGTFLDDRRTDQPLFLYVNFHDTHFPYHHSGIQPLVSDSLVEQADIAPEHADAVRAMYLNTAANVDRAIGHVLAHVRRVRGREPGVIVLSDHGESLFDEGFLGHGYALNDAQTRIPLVAANLPMRLVEPFAQVDLRDAIARAMEQPYAPGATPAVEENPSRTVFQYLGLITRPVEIGLTGPSSRTLYDFRAGKVKIDSDTWRRPDELASAAHTRFLQLVQLWERMMLARHSAASNE